MFGGLTGYSLVGVHFIGTGRLWQIKRFGGGLTRIQYKLHKVTHTDLCCITDLC